MYMLKENESASTVFGVNRKRRFEEFDDQSLFSNFGKRLKGILSWYPVGTTPEKSDQVALEANAFARMCNLKLLQLNYVQLIGRYENFPKGLRWLCWHRFPLQSIPNDFRMERLLVLEMPFSSLRNVWGETKFMRLLKILDLSHSHSLVETPNFLMVPNLERLVLENCTSLVKIHGSIGHLERLVLLNLKDCVKLAKLPKSVGRLKSLEILDISGCSNLEKLSTELENMESLKVFHADGICINQLLSTTSEVKLWYVFIWPWLLNPINTWANSLPRSLVSLSLVNCNLSDDAFPRDLSSLSSLRELDLSENPICNLPDCIRDLTWLQILILRSCSRLQLVEGPHKIKELSVRDSKLLKKISFPDYAVSNFYRGCESLVEILGLFKLEPIGNVDVEIMNNLGLSDLGSMGKRNVKLISPCNLPKLLPLQGCHEKHIFYTYVLGSEVPGVFNLKNRESSISFTVPSHDLNFSIRSLSVCAVFKNFDAAFDTDFHTIMSNTTKRLKWSHCPNFLGIPKKADEDMKMLSYWKFENPLEGGDEMNIEVVTAEGFQVKEVGVHLVQKEQQQEEKSAQSNNGEIQPYGKVMPSTVSADPAVTMVYRIGLHKRNCQYCPQPSCLHRFKNLNRWISTRRKVKMPWARHLMMPSTYPPPY